MLLHFGNTNAAILERFFLSSKVQRMTRAPAQRHLHHDLSQQNIPNLFCLEKLKGLDLYESSVEQIQQCLSQGHFTSVDYIKFCLERIRVVNPYLECVIEVNPDAVEIAAKLDEERRQVSGQCCFYSGMGSVTLNQGPVLDNC